METLPTTQLATVDMAPVTAKQLQQQVNVIQEVMKQVMKEGVHFGVIQGCGDKPGLFKPGAEKLSLMFRLMTSFDVSKIELGNGHREYSVVCNVRDVQGRLIGQGVGSCSTMESKYRYRNGERKCPACGKATIIKGKADYGGGWLCFGKKGGCGAKYQDGDHAIEGQHVGRVDNPDIADQYNTVLKMAKKRAHVDGVLTTTGASDIFTQDIEDMEPAEYSPRQETSAPKTPIQDPVYYDFSNAELKKEQVAFLQEHCTYDQERGVWACKQDLGQKLAKFRVQVGKPNEAPVEAESNQDDDVPESWDTVKLQSAEEMAERLEAEMAAKAKLAAMKEANKQKKAA